MTIEPGFDYGNDATASGVNISIPSGGGAPAWLTFNLVDEVYPDPCGAPEVPTSTPLGPTVDELVAALRSLKGYQAGPDNRHDRRRPAGQIIRADRCGHRHRQCPDLDLARFEWGGHLAQGLVPDGGPRSMQGQRPRLIRISALDVDGTRFTFTARTPTGTTADDLAPSRRSFDSILRSSQGRGPVARPASQRIAVCAWVGRTPALVIALHSERFGFRHRS